MSKKITYLLISVFFVLSVISISNVHAAGVVGRVTDGLSAPIAGVNVDIYDLSGNKITTVLTDGTGRYASCIPAGCYKIYFYEMNHTPQWYNNQTTMALANVVTLTDGATVVANAVLESFGGISGVVTDTGVEAAEWLPGWSKASTE